MIWSRIVLGCSTAALVAATYFEGGIRTPNSDTTLQTKQYHHKPQLARRSSRIQRRGNCAGRLCKTKEREPKGPHSTRASVIVQGPGTVQTKIANNSFRITPVEEGEQRHIKSSHPNTAYVGVATVNSKTIGSPDTTDRSHLLKVKSRGRQVQALISVPEGGYGRVRLRGDNGVKDIHVQPGTMGGGTAVSRTPGGARAWGQVSRGGEAHIWGHDDRPYDV